jgi:NAD(P)-dependent dehydrogenase (short-subunit alcohol dehydrogenase family)
MRLKNHIAIITGGASGIGRASVELFVGEGARVAIIDRNDSTFDELAALDAGRDVIRGYKAEVTDIPAADRIVDEIRRAWGKIDILVTAAGISVGKRLGDTTPDEWRQVMEVNLGGTYRWIRAVLPVMLEQNAGAIVTVGSQLSTAGGKSNAAYVTSKGAIHSLTRSVALDYVQSGIRCNCVAPGGTETRLLANAFARSQHPDKARKELTMRHPMQRLAKPQEIAQGILYLASPESSFVTGTQLVIDGGWLTA